MIRIRVHVNWVVHILTRYFGELTLGASKSEVLTNWDLKSKRLIIGEFSVKL